MENFVNYWKSGQIYSKKKLYQKNDSWNLKTFSLLLSSIFHPALGTRTFTYINWIRFLNLIIHHDYRVRPRCMSNMYCLYPFTVQHNFRKRYTYLCQFKHRPLPNRINLKETKVLIVIYFILLEKHMCDTCDCMCVNFQTTFGH